MGKIDTISDDFKCRVCSGRNGIRLLFQSDKRQTVHMLTTLANISVKHDDPLPKCICNGCIVKLTEGYNFKMLCEKSDREHRRRLGLPEPRICRQDKSIVEPDEPGAVLASLYECRRCNLCFSNSLSLQKHFATHAPHPCQFCGQKFGALSVLRNHEKSHMVCETCGITTSNKESYLSHKKSHELLEKLASVPEIMNVAVPPKNVSLAQPHVATPSFAQPAVTQLPLAQPHVAQHSLAQPSKTQLSLAQTSLTQPTVARPPLAQPSLVQPPKAQLPLVQTSLAQRSTTQLPLAQPSLVQPTVARVPLAQPSLAQPSLPPPPLIPVGMPVSIQGATFSRIPAVVQVALSPKVPVRVVQSVGGTKTPGQNVRKRNAQGNLTSNARLVPPLTTNAANRGNLPNSQMLIPLLLADKTIVKTSPANVTANNPMLIKRVQKFKCNFCSLFFDRLSELNIHQVEHIHKNNLALYAAPKPDKKATRNASQPLKDAPISKDLVNEYVTSDSSKNENGDLIEEFKEEILSDESEFEPQGSSANTSEPNADAEIKEEVLCSHSPSSEIIEITHDSIEIYANHDLDANQDVDNSQSVKQTEPESLENLKQLPLKPLVDLTSDKEFENELLSLCETLPDI